MTVNSSLYLNAQAAVEPFKKAVLKRQVIICLGLYVAFTLVGLIVPLVDGTWTAAQGVLTTNLIYICAILMHFAGDEASNVEVDDATLSKLADIEGMPGDLIKSLLGSADHKGRISNNSLSSFLKELAKYSDQQTDKVEKDLRDQEPGRAKLIALANEEPK